MEGPMEKKLESSVKWVGMSIATASTACTLAIIADTAAAIRGRKFWIPCKYFRLNAFWLTVLSITAKLPFDYTKIFYGLDDKLARLSSLLLVAIAMGNFTTSLGAMDDKEILLNLSALSVLVVSVSGSQFLRLIQIRKYWGSIYLEAEQMTASVLMFPLLVMLCSLAVMVSAARRRIDSKNREMRERVVSGTFYRGGLKLVVMKYWVMAETGSLQFVIARSLISVPIGVFSVLIASILIEADIRLHSVYAKDEDTASSYKNSTKWILFAQRTGVILGTVAPLMRLFMVARLKSTTVGCKRWREEFKVEKYWTQTLVEWKERPVPLQIRHQMISKLVHDVKGIVSNFFIVVQKLIVFLSKLQLFVLGTFLAIFSASLDRIKSFKRQKSTPGNKPDMSQFVVLLEGEVQLPSKALDALCNEMERLILIGKMKPKKNLMNLLSKSKSFDGVREFDSPKIPSLPFHHEPPNCWSLPVVTLAAIALAVSDTNCEVNQLLRGVSEGLAVLKLVERGLDEDGALLGIQNAASVVWVRIQLYKKWLDKDIQTRSSSQSHQEKLQELSHVAKGIVMDFVNDSDDFILENPTNWPANVIAANSMYRITQTLMVDRKIRHCKSGAQLFHRISIMISDILAACLVNSEQAIIRKCHGDHDVIEWARQVREAAILLGEIDEILELILQNHAIPRLDPDRPASIEEFRAYV